MLDGQKATTYIIDMCNMYKYEHYHDINDSDMKNLRILELLNIKHGG